MGKKKTATTIDKQNAALEAFMLALVEAGLHGVHNFTNPRVLIPMGSNEVEVTWSSRSKLYHVAVYTWMNHVVPMPKAPAMVDPQSVVEYIVEMWGRTVGHNATGVVMVDALHEIAEDPQFGKKLASAVRNIAAYGSWLRDSDRCRPDVSAGCHVNAATVIEVHHSDTLVPVLMGGNSGYKIDDVYLSYCQYGEDGEIALMRQLAEKHGFRVSKKPEKKRDAAEQK